MSEPPLSRATALLERWGCGYPARVNELAEMLESVRAQGRQEGFAECREMAAEVVESDWQLARSKKTAAKVRSIQPPREEKG